MRYREFSNNLNPAIPYLFLYDATGAQTFTNAGQFHTWDTTKIKTQHFQYTSDTDEIELKVSSSGLYMLEFDCSFATYVAATIQIISSVYKNGSELGGSRAVTTVLAAAQTPTVEDEQVIHYVVFLERGDKIKIHTITSNAGVTYSLSNTSRLLISFINMKGWDNSSGGRIDYKGGVSR